MGDNSYLADMMNTQGVAGLYGSNPYLQFTGQIPMAGYRGTPTDAAGNPIASFGQAQAAHDAWAAANPAPAQGTTLNSAPQSSTSSGPYQPGSAQGQAWQAMMAQPAAQQNMATAAASAASGGNTPGAYYAQGNSGFGSNQYANANPPLVPFQQSQGQGQGQQPQQAAPAASTNPVDMRQAYLDALSNPGKVNTPGAQMLPGTSPTGPQSQPSVLAQFLAQHPGGGTTGGGGYSNQGFFNTLNALKQGATT